MMVGDEPVTAFRVAVAISREGQAPASVVAVYMN